MNEPRSQDGESGEEGSSEFLHDAKTASGSKTNTSNDESVGYFAPTGVFGFGFTI